MDKLKKVILQKISEDKQKYSMKGRSRKEVVKTSVYDKLDWFEKYTMKKSNKLLPDFADKATSYIIAGD